MAEHALPRFYSAEKVTGTTAETADLA